MGSVVHDKIARDIYTVTIENAQNRKTAQDICKNVVQNAKEKVLRKSARDVSKVAIDNAQIRILRETACDLCRTTLVNATGMENATQDKRKIVSPPPMLPFNCTQAITKRKKTYPTFEPGLAKTGMPIVITL